MDAETRARIESLEGKVLAAQVAIRALIACHPAPEKAIDTVCEHLDRFAAIALSDLLPDALTDALASAEHTILPTNEELQRARL